MDFSPLLLSAVENQVDWAEAVAQAHNLKNYRTDSLWYCTEQMPVFFANAICTQPNTLDPTDIRKKLANVPKPWVVKDSYHKIQNINPSFPRLYNMHWYYYKPIRNKPAQYECPSLQTVSTADELKHWVKLWLSDKMKGMQFDVVLNENILTNKATTIVYLTDQDTISCGASLFASRGVMSVNNLFGNIEEQQRLIRTIQLNYPEVTLVGYGDDSELAVLKPFGFHRLADLSVLMETR